MKIIRLIKTIKQIQKIILLAKTKHQIMKLIMPQSPLQKQMKLITEKMIQYQTLIIQIQLP